MPHETILAAALAAPAVVAAYGVYWRLMSRSSTLQSIDVADASKHTPAITHAHAEGPRQGGGSMRNETIVIGDLFLDHDDHFMEPLKVTGDLIVAGHARFDGTVTVNGYVHVRRQGSASFNGGLIAKCDILAEGRTTMGRNGDGWCIARAITGEIACGEALETEPVLQAA